MATESLRYHFDSLESAAEVLEALLWDARTTEVTYRFGPLTPQQVLVSGLLVEGELKAVKAKLDKIPGTTSTPE